MVALVVGMGLLAGGCVKKAAVAAEAVGVVAESPFFARLGGGDHDGVGPAAGGGEQSGAKKGLFGGSLSKKRCKTGALISFLLDPKNRKKALAWAEALGIDVSDIKKFIAELTPVLLGNDTLVRNHRFKNGKAEGYDALLQAGIAVLIDARGVPVVKCNCGNPLKEPKHDLGDIKVEIPDDLSKRWKHDKDKDVIVRPGKKKVGKFVLRDVDRPGRVIDRPVGPATGDTSRKDTGDDDSHGGDGEEVLVPDLRGASRDEATRKLTEAGLTAEFTEQPSDTAGPGTVISQSPDPATTLKPGATVTLVIAVATASPSPEPTGPLVEPTEPGSPLPSVDPTQLAPSTEPAPQQTPGELP
ncbi:DUF6777 domain-containing protein [Streptomyces sp. NPDC005322]|uniref:DUF6777 domain-containing protein n=1 Tax=unclassified Streptomyces TaxID=2593676 RepID=UPI0033A67C6C